MKPVNIGLLGLGTVGGGTAAVLRDNAEEISRRLGREIRISAVCDLSEEKPDKPARPQPLSKIRSNWSHVKTSMSSSNCSAVPALPKMRC